MIIAEKQFICDVQLSKTVVEYYHMLFSTANNTTENCPNATEIGTHYEKIENPPPYEKSAIRVNSGGNKLFPSIPSSLHEQRN